MSDIQGQTDRPLGEELDDFDVEGHGLRSAAALGLSAATIVASGAGAAAMTIGNPLPGTTDGAKAAVAGASSDVQAALADTGRAVDGATTVLVTTASPALSTVSSTVDTTATFASDTVKSTKALAEELAADPVGTTDKKVDQTVLTAREIRDGALVTATDTAATAGQTATAATTVAVGAVSDVHAFVDPSADADIQDDDATITARAAGKTVTVSTR